MNAIRASNVIVIRPRAARTASHQVPARPVLRAVWRVSAETGRPECTWIAAEAAENPYSRAA